MHLMPPPPRKLPHTVTHLSLPTGTVALFSSNTAHFTAHIHMISQYTLARRWPLAIATSSCLPSSLGPPYLPEQALDVPPLYPPCSLDTLHFCHSACSSSPACHALHPPHPVAPAAPRPRGLPVCCFQHPAWPPACRWCTRWPRLTPPMHPPAPQSLCRAPACYHPSNVRHPSPDRLAPSPPSGLPFSFRTWAFPADNLLIFVERHVTSFYHSITPLSPPS